MREAVRARRARVANGVPRGETWETPIGPAHAASLQMTGPAGTGQQESGAKRTAIRDAATELLLRPSAVGTGIASAQAVSYPGIAELFFGCADCGFSGCPGTRNDLEVFSAVMVEDALTEPSG